MNTQCLALDLHRLDLRLAGARVADRERSRSHSHRLAMRGYLALIAIAVARLAASRARTGATTLRPAAPRSTQACFRSMARFWYNHITTGGAMSVTLTNAENKLATVDAALVLMARR
jgi:hypothetical protein